MVIKLLKMKYSRIFLSLFFPLVLTIGCAPQRNVAEPPAGWERIPPPSSEHFDAEQVMAAAKRVLHYKGAVCLMSMNRQATEGDVGEIIDGLKDIHSRGEPVVFVSRDVHFVSDSVGRALRSSNIDLKYLKVVVAAPTEPSQDFLELLRSRGIEYYYVQMVRAEPGQQPSSA